MSFVLIDPAAKLAEKYGGSPSDWGRIKKGYHQGMKVGGIYKKILRSIKNKTVEKAKKIAGYGCVPYGMSISHYLENKLDRERYPIKNGQILLGEC